MKHLNILLVDDDELDRAYYKQMLLNESEFDYTVFEADNATVALECCERQHIDCIILDYLLPGMNGIEFVKFLKNKLDRPIATIMLTGQGDETVAVAAMKEGISDYVIKNQINPHNLARTVTEAVQKNDVDVQIEIQKEQLKHYAYYDQLTGALNRHAFADAAIRAISDSKRHQRAIAIAYIDVDYFKKVNDSHGHSVGDELLKELTQRVTHILRKEDIIARLGGDEFAILLTGLNQANDVDFVATRLLKTIRESYHLDGQVVNITASMGIACYPEDGEDFTNLLKNADIALYKAKENGRGIFVHYTEELKNIQQKRIFIEHALNYAIPNHQLKIFYQPIFELATKKLVGVEALLRWQHPELGILTPDKFLPIAEETGMIVEMDDWVIQYACYQLESWSKLLKKYFYVSINISLKTISKPKFIWTLKRLINDIKIPPNCIELEFKESALMLLDANTSLFSELQNLGVRLAVDNFGREYSSFQKLKKLPLNSLKIDGTYIGDISRGKADAAIVKSIINIAKDLNLQVCAEGIETEHQLVFLIKHGCLYGQGFYFSKPLPPDQMTEFFFHQTNDANL